MANVAFTISPAPGVINDMIAVLYDTGGAEIDRIDIPAPHSSPQNLNFPNVAPKTYIVKIHETPGGGVLGNLRHDFWVDASLSKLLAYTVKTFQVGLGRGTPYYDPANQDVDYINPDLNGLDYTVFKPGYGPLDWSANITTYTGGGFSFTDGQKFSQDEIYTLLIANLISQPVPQTGVGYPDDVVERLTPFTFGSADYNKLLMINGSVDVFIITFPDFATIPEATLFGITTHHGTQRYVTLQLPAGRYCMLNGSLENTVDIAMAEEVTFMKKGHYLWIVDADWDYRRVGEKVFTDAPPANSLSLTGGWQPKAGYPRLFKWVNRLDPTILGSGFTDDQVPDSNQRVKWIIGIDKFWVPDHGGYFYRNCDPDGNIDVIRPSGYYQADSVGPANVKTTAWTGGGIGKNSLTADSIGFLATQGDGGQVSSDSASGTNRNTARTVTFPIISTEGETRPKNIATPVYVII
jgi:hypothetical protein